MKTLTLEIKDETIADRIIWMLQHFKNDGLVIKEDIYSTQEDVKTSIKQAVNELNMAKDGKLKAKPVEDLLNAL
ncbi:MAG: hypothetical protein QG565_1273 [Campylobacterota bacterium]|nr:hypothetical protein [Campylobacterota bacterium]MDQ1268691.1 hypothetical protein [Campylobacterota bacterium]